jgi:TonB family protein
MAPLLTSIFWKASLILAVPFAAGLWRRSSAATRHFLWTAAFAALLLLPAAALVMPHWTPPEPAILAQSTVVTATPSAPAPPTIPVLPMAWVTGCLLVAVRFLAGAVRAARLVRRASPAVYAQERLQALAHALGIRRPVRALQTAAVPVPLAWGILRPVVLLPHDAPAWPETRREAVLLHELIHVRRHDLLSQFVAQAACCVYWFHPLAWVALREMRKERERACDDAVLLSGVTAHDYAGHLMDLVRLHRRGPWASAPAMAQSSDFESRIRALLDRTRNRRPLSRRAAVAIAALALAVLLPFAGITARAQTSRAALAGTVEDPSGARVPNCRVTAKSLDSSNQEVTTSNQSGEYQFASIPAGRYAVEFSARGFALAKMEATLTAGTPARADAHLALGNVSENVVIRGQKPPTAAPMAAGGPRIRIGGMVTVARLLSQVKPSYPADLQQQGVEGTVIMAAVISKSGTVLNPRVRNTVDPRLAQAALDAVKQWVYEPARLNGEPVETITTITLEFQLGQ